MTDALRGGAGARVQAQAKVNLRLRILAREVSGYHQLETLFLRLALADTVRVRLTAGARSLDVDGLPPGATLGPVERNLAWRAADAYLTATGQPGGVAIELVKRIPVGGGLGGGSADAGAVLRALEALAPRPLGEHRLLALAGALGADVPFLASEHAYALAWGRGERMLGLTPPPVRAVALVVPPFAVNTVEAYGWLAAARGAVVPVPVPGVLEPGGLASWETLMSLAVNDFEPVVGTRHPEIAWIVAALGDAGCRPALMSGSGSVVFGVFPESVARADTGDMVPAALGAVLLTETASRVEAVQALA